MKLFVKLIFVANFLFLGGGFLIAFFQFIAYNGFGDIFEYVKPEQLETHIKIDSIKETKTIFYKYVVDQKVYESKQSVYIPSIAECDFYENSVYYNKKIPFLSYVGTKELKLNSPESGMVVFGFFFLFIFFFVAPNKLIALIHQLVKHLIFLMLDLLIMVLLYLTFVLLQFLIL